MARYFKRRRVDEAWALSRCRSLDVVISGAVILFVLSVGVNKVSEPAA